VDRAAALGYERRTVGGEGTVDTPETPDKEPENPELSVDPMSLLAALLNATGVLRVRKRPRRKRQER
jgi:hypothetical protein